MFFFAKSSSIFGFITKKHLERPQKLVSALYSELTGFFTRMSLDRTKEKKNEKNINMRKEPRAGLLLRWFHYTEAFHPFDMSMGPFALSEFNWSLGLLA